MLDLGKFAELGRNGDDTIGHLTTGERIIPKGVLGAELTNKIIQEMEASGLDPSQYVVGNKNNSLNPATGQPEFAITTPGQFDFGPTPFGSHGRMARLQTQMTPFVESQADAIAGLTQQVVPTSTILGTTMEGRAELSPQMQQFVDQNAMQGGLFNNQIGQQLAQSQLGSNQLQDAYSSFGPSSYTTRQDLENLFMDQAGMQSNQNTMFNNSNLASLIGGAGGGTSTYSGAGALEGANRLANQQLRIGAYQGAQNAFNSEIEGLQRMLTGASGLETAAIDRARGSQEAFNTNLANLGSIGQSQIDQMMLGRGLGEDATNFQMNRLAGVMGAFNPQLQLAAFRASTPKASKGILGTGITGGDLLRAGGAALKGYSTGGWGEAAMAGFGSLGSSTG